MDYTNYTVAELTSMANALDSIMNSLADETLPSDFVDTLGEVIDMNEQERSAFMSDLYTAANVSAYADGKDSPFDIVTPILSDEQAIEHADLYKEWTAGVAYKIGDRIRYEDTLYKCVQAHTSQEGWEPPATPALWTKVHPEGTIPEWEQPTGAQDAYAKGDKVKHNGQTWVSDVDANVWEPGVYGWTGLLNEE
jgi:hypothetical protein